MFALLTQRRWLGHVRRMWEGQSYKSMLAGVLATGSRPAGRPVLRYFCKRDTRAGDIDPAGWETKAADHSTCRITVKAGVQRSEVKKRGAVGREQRAETADTNALKDQARNAPAATVNSAILRNSPAATL